MNVHPLKPASRLYILAVLLCLFGCSSDSGIRQASSGHLVFSGQFAFPKTGPTEVEAGWVEVRNSGTSPIVMADFLAPADEDLTPSWRVSLAAESGLPPTQSGLPDRLTLAPGAVLYLALRFQPTEARIPHGVLSFRTNSSFASEQHVRLSVSGLRAVGELHASQAHLLFGQVAVGAMAERETVITNMGTDTVYFDEIALSSTDELDIRINGIDPMTDRSIILDPDQDGLRGVAQDGEFTVSVILRPSRSQPVVETLSLLSSAVNDKLTIDITGNGAGSCLRVLPTRVDFSETVLERTGHVHIRVESCGDKPVTIESMELVDAEGVFSILSQPDLPGRLSHRQNVQGPLPGADVSLGFTPKDEIPYGGILRIRSNDPVNPLLEVPISGQGITNLCPRAVATSQTLVVHPLDTVLLDGSESTDPDSPTGRPVDYEWVVIERPVGSTSQPVERFHDISRPADGGEPDARSTPVAQFFADLAGEYVLALRVVDRHGASAPSAQCPQDKAHLRIRAIPSQTLHVQLVWDTPDDRDQTDELGTDVDLHLRHPSSDAWFTSSGDCYYLNPRADWGQVGDPDDDPSLDIDDVNGAGPENINIHTPENTAELGQPYRIGVHYFDAKMTALGEVGDALETVATVRVYVEGTFVFEDQRRLFETDDFWHVAEFYYDEEGGRLTELDRLDSAQP